MSAVPGPVAGSSARPAAEVVDLRVSFRDTEVVRGVSFVVHPGETVALVGESGSGKSVTARSLVGLAGPGAVVRAETLAVGGRSVPALSSRELRRLRGGEVGLIAQDAFASLDPLRPVGREIADALRLHTSLSAAERRVRVVELLERVGVPEPELRASQRPHELSGGLRQRALIAAAVAASPRVLVADEPTTALDATVQAGILDLLASLAAEGTAILLISHDLAVVSRLADRVLVMRDGAVVEEGATRAVITDPAHPYTRALVAAVPTDRPRHTALAPAVPGQSAGAPGALGRDAVAPAALGRGAGSRRPDAGAGAGADEHARHPDAGSPSPAAPVLEARSITVRFPVRDGRVLRAVSDVSLALEPGRTLGIVGESGSGKTTLARVLLGLQRPDAGTVTVEGRAWSPAPERDRRPFRRILASVPQDPYGTLDPRWTIRRTLADALGTSDPDAVGALLDRVRLPRELADRGPERLSPGQRQRVAVARAVAGTPRILVADEPVSSLDVSVQAQILDLLDELQRDLGLAIVLVSHDLGVIRHSTDDVLVLRAGEVVEHGPTERVFREPEHDYTRTLVAAAPRLHS